MTLVGALSLIAMAMQAAPAEAEQQAADTTEGDPIVVTGERGEETLIGSVRELDIGITNRQYSRWGQRLCMTYRGWRDDYEAALGSRIEQLLDYYFKDTSQDEDCRPNVEIVFSDDPDKYFEDLKDKAGRIYLNFPGRNRQKVESSSDEVRILAGVRPVNRDGRAIYKEGAAPPPGLGVLGAFSEVLVQGTGVGDSRIGTSVRNDYAVAVVVVDAKETKGLSLLALADYITLRLLTGAQDGAPSGFDSVLDLFDAKQRGDELPLGLTYYDEALLTGFADIPAAQKATLQRSALARRMQKRLAETSEE